MLHIPQGLNLSPGIKLIKINSNFSFVSSKVWIWIYMSILKKSNNANEKNKEQKKGMIAKLLVLTFSCNYKHSFLKSKFCSFMFW